MDLFFFFLKFIYFFLSTDLPTTRKVVTRLHLGLNGDLRDTFHWVTLIHSPNGWGCPGVTQTPTQSCSELPGHGHTMSLTTMVSVSETTRESEKEQLPRGKMRFCGNSGKGTCFPEMLVCHFWGTVPTN